MARGTTFGEIHSSTDLHLIQQKVDVQPAPPKLHFVDIPGANGAKDLSAAPAGRVVYGDREIVWTFALYPGDDWPTKRSQVSGALNGRYLDIELDEDPGYFYHGRLTVDSHETDGLLRQIVVRAMCKPYKTASAVSSITTAAASVTHRITLDGHAPVVPEITVSKAAQIVWGGTTYNLSAGTRKILDIELQPGVNTMTLKPSGVAFTFRYTEGWL